MIESSRYFYQHYGSLGADLYDLCLNDYDEFNSLVSQVMNHASPSNRGKLYNPNTGEFSGAPRLEVDFFEALRRLSSMTNTSLRVISPKHYFFGGKQYSVSEDNDDIGRQFVVRNGKSDLRQLSALMVDSISCPRVTLELSTLSFFSRQRLNAPQAINYHADLRSFSPDTYYGKSPLLSRDDSIATDFFCLSTGILRHNQFARVYANNIPVRYRNNKLKAICDSYTNYTTDLFGTHFNLHVPTIYDEMYTCRVLYPDEYFSYENPLRIPSLVARSLAQIREIVDKSEGFSCCIGIVRFDHDHVSSYKDAFSQFGVPLYCQPAVFHRPVYWISTKPLEGFVKFSFDLLVRNMPYFAGFSKLRNLAMYLRILPHYPSLIEDYCGKGRPNFLNFYNRAMFYVFNSSQMMEYSNSLVEEELELLSESEVLTVFAEALNYVVFDENDVTTKDAYVSGFDLDRRRWYLSFLYHSKTLMFQNYIRRWDEHGRSQYALTSKGYEFLRRGKPPRPSLLFVPSRISKLNESKHISGGDSACDCLMCSRVLGVHEVLSRGLPVFHCDFLTKELNQSLQAYNENGCDPQIGSSVLTDIEHFYSEDFSDVDYGVLYDVLCRHRHDLDKLMGNLGDRSRFAALHKFVCCTQFGYCFKDDFV
jgi:hypothetical protein